MSCNEDGGGEGVWDGDFWLSRCPVLPLKFELLPSKEPKPGQSQQSAAEGEECDKGLEFESMMPFSKAAVPIAHVVPRYIANKLAKRFDELKDSGSAAQLQRPRLTCRIGLGQAMYAMIPILCDGKVAQHAVSTQLFFCCCIIPSL